MIAVMVLASVSASLLSLVASSLLGMPAHLLVLPYVVVGCATMILLALAMVAVSMRGR